MSPKRKTKQPPANISITGGVKGVGNVVGNESQSNVTVSSPTEAPASSLRSSGQSIWGRAVAFLVTLSGIFVAAGIFVRLLEGFDAIMVAEFVLAGLISALGITGVLKPKILTELFGKMLGKK